MLLYDGDAKARVPPRSIPRSGIFSAVREVVVGASHGPLLTKGTKTSLPSPEAQLGEGTEHISRELKEHKKTLPRK